MNCTNKQQETCDVEKRTCKRMLLRKRYGKGFNSGRRKSMEIKTKYNIGQHIWVVYEDRVEVTLYDTVIDSIDIDKDGYNYYVKEGEDYPEEQIIPYEDTNKLVARYEGNYEFDEDKYYSFCSFKEKTCKESELNNK